MLQLSTRRGPSFCNARSAVDPPRRAIPRRSAVARPMLLFAGMKDLLFVGVTLAFFALGWIYVRALDRL